MMKLKGYVLSKDVNGKYVVRGSYPVERLVAEGLTQTWAREATLCNEEIVEIGIIPYPYGKDFKQELGIA